MRQLILILPLLLAAASVLPPPQPDKSALPFESKEPAVVSIQVAQVKTAANETLAAPAPSPTEELLATSEPVECAGLTAFLEAVSTWEIPERNERTEKKMKLVLKNSLTSTVTLPHNGVDDLRLSRSGSDIEGQVNRWGRSRPMPLPIEARESSIILVRAILSWQGRHLRLSFHDEMGRTWSFDGLQAGAYEIAAVYWPSKSSTKLSHWTGPLETTDLRIRLVPAKGASVLDNLEF